MKHASPESGAAARVCAADDCSETFTPYRASGRGAQSFCSPRCRRRMSDKRRWSAHRDDPGAIAQRRAWQQRQAARPERREKQRRLNLARYGITPETWDRMYAEQGGVCAICSRPANGTGPSNGSLHVDHDHETGAVRGLLCLTCNVGVGYFNDDAERLAAAAAYLTRNIPTTQGVLSCSCE